LGHKSPWGLRTWRLRVPRWTLWPLAVVTGGLLLAGAAQGLGKYSLDLYEYQCYAVAFWRGWPGVQALPAGQCDIMFAVLSAPPSAHPFHTLPQEYGALSLALFSPPLLAPDGWYLWLFSAEMVLVVIATAVVCAHAGPRLAGHAYLLYVLLGTALIAGTRFDAAPALLTLLAVVWAGHGRRTLAYVALALATLLKVYPIVLLLPFLIADLRAADARYRRALVGLASYAAVTALGIGLALLASASGTLGPLVFLAHRGIEYESLPATLLLLAHVGLHVPFALGYEVNVTTVVSPLGGVASPVSLALAVALVAGGAWLQWWRKLTLGQACLVMLLAVLASSKVLSPQYLLWVSPLVALEYGLDAMWWLGWGIVCGLTALVFPTAYDESFSGLGIPAWQAVVWLSALRNFALLLFATAILWRPQLAARPVSRETPGG
jgi:Glycosyltransferase family 87